MSEERSFIEYLVFMNKFVMLWEILKFSPETFENYSIQFDKETKISVLIDNQGNIVSDNTLFEDTINIELNEIGWDAYLRFINNEMFTEDEIAEIIRTGLIITFK